MSANETHIRDTQLFALVKEHLFEIFAYTPLQAEVADAVAQKICLSLERAAMLRPSIAFAPIGEKNDTKGTNI